MMLEQIARRERELRARLIEARGRAGELRDRAAKAAGDIRAAGEAAAVAEARAWFDQEMEQARRQAEALVAQHLGDGSGGGGEAGDAVPGQAVRFIVDAVLPPEPNRRAGS